MRRVLAAIMAMIMLMTSVPVLAEGSASASSAKKSGSTIDTTVSLAESVGFEPTYAEFIRTGHIYSDEALKKPVGQASRGDVVYALNRKEFGSSKVRVRVCWVSGGKEQIGWIKASFLRLMSDEQSRAYVQKVRGNAKVVRTDGRYLLPIAAYKQTSSSSTQSSSTSAKPNYTVTLDKSAGFKPAYAVFTRTGHIYSDEDMKNPVGQAYNGDVVYALTRKDYGTDKARVRVAWVSGGKEQIGWIKASFLRLMSSEQGKEYVNGVTGNAKVVRTDGRYLLPIAAYKANSGSAPATTKAPTVTSEPEKKPETEDRATHPSSTLYTPITTSKGLQLWWKPVADANNYQIWRSTKPTSGFTRLAVIRGANNWLDTTAKRNTVYYYQVRCGFTDGTVTTSATYGHWNDWGPTITQSRNSTTGVVTLSWGARTGAVKYAVYRAPAGSSTYSYVSIQTGLSYVDKNVTNGQTYSYYILASYKTSDGKTVTGSKGAAVNVSYGVQPVSSVTATGVAGGIKLTWPAAANAVGYRVLYRAGTSGNFTQIGTTNASTRTFTHRAPAYGKEIQYVVRSEGRVNGAAVLAAYTYATTAAVGIPTLTLKAGDGVINASWTACSGANAYKIYYKHESDTEFSGATLTDRSMAIPAVKAGKYQVYVRGVYNAPSGKVYNGTSSAISTFTAAGVDLSDIPVMTVSGGDNQLNVSWDKVDGATYYMVKVTGNGETRSYKYAGSQLSAVIPVNAGDYTVSMYAIFPDGDGRSCASQTVTVTGETLAAPALTVSKGEAYNTVQFVWEPVTGADAYVLTVTGNGQTFTYEGSE
ncbi:MAG: hypothetical protein IKK21_10190, partial [Clostridia bacterium]|nr:hypothetical protein [Clostridia bacterium]